MTPINSKSPVNLLPWNSDIKNKYCQCHIYSWCLGALFVWSFVLSSWFYCIQIVPFFFYFSRSRPLYVCFVLFVFVLCLACQMLPVSLDCPLFIAHSVFSNVYLSYCILVNHIWWFTYENIYSLMTYVYDTYFNKWLHLCYN
jgi:hypothetical protein